MSDKHSNIFIDNIDKEKFTADIEVVKEDKVYLEEISNKLTFEFTSYIDKLMQKIWAGIKQDGGLGDQEIETYFLDLTSALYFLGDKLESLGIELTVASSRNQEVFNRIHQESEGTIKDKQARAEEGTKYEHLLKSIYESVYKRIKMKMDAGYEMVSSLKRVIMKRVAEMDLTKKSQGGGQGGNLGKRRAAYEGDD